MKNINTNQLIEYLSLTFTFTYFIFHNILLVLIGIILSLYIININTINNLKKYINKNFIIKNESKDSYKIDREINSNTINIKSTKEENRLTLVEEIEKFGFIPSIDNKSNNNAA